MAGVTRHQLSNGLTVILKEQHSAPVVSWWVMYRIGRRNERTGQIGISCLNNAIDKVVVSDNLTQA